MAPHYLKAAIPTLLTVALGYFLVRNLSTAPPPPSARETPKAPAPVNRVSALGSLQPLGDVIALAAPTQAYNMQPLVASINVKEGQRIREGETLAVFDTYERLKSQETSALEQIKSLQDQYRILASETNRYRQLYAEQAAPASEKNQRELNLLELQTKLVQARSDLKKIREDKRYSVLTSPIDGTVLKIFSRPGERVMPYGVMKVGRTDRMGALLQVYESYIGRVKVGAPVLLRSENGSFRGTINGHVVRIAPMIGAKENLTLDPSADSDKESRTFDVEVSIDSDYNSKVRFLTGAKVVAQFK